MKNTFSRNPNDTHDLLKVRMSQALHCTPQCTKEREGIPSSGSCPRRAGHRRSRSARVISLVPTSATPFPHKTSILQPSRLPVVDEDDMWPRPAPLFSNSSFKTRMKERENAAGSLGSVQVYMRSRVRGGCSMNATYRFPDSAGQGSWVNLPDTGGAESVGNASKSPPMTVSVSTSAREMLVPLQPQRSFSSPTIPIRKMAQNKSKRHFSVSAILD